MMNEVVRVLLADDHILFREALRGLLENHGLQVVGEAGDGYEAVRLTRKKRPHLVLMDIGMPRMNGIEATRRIMGDDLPTKVLGLSTQSAERFVKELLRAGASGYLLKECRSEELLRAIALVLKGNVYLSPSLTTMVVTDYMAGRVPGEASVFAHLTRRERQVLQLLAEGESTKEIADKLGISVKTAHVHRQNIMTKLNLNSVAELTRYAIREGLTQL
jgi:DNA-binding NarL/FixJ family response regulator